MERGILKRRILPTGHHDRRRAATGHSDLVDPAVHERRPQKAFGSRWAECGVETPTKTARNVVQRSYIWAIRFYLDEHKRLRNRALFVLAIPLLRAYYFVAS